MKKLLIFTALILSAATSYGQHNSRITETEENPVSTRTEPEEITEPIAPQVIANLTQTINQTENTYSFVSNKEFFDHQEDRWEYRLKVTYPYIITIQLTAQNQTVLLTLPTVHTQEELRAIVEFFNFSDYLISQ